MTTDSKRAAESAADVDPESILLEHDILEPCADEDDLCLAEDVSEAWHERMPEVRDGDHEDLVAEFLDLDEEILEKLDEQEKGIEILTHEERGLIHVKVNRRLVARWESAAAMFADFAGATVLAEEVPEWEDFEIEQRSQLANGLRAFVERCPSCEGDVSLTEDKIESCCRTREVYAVVCEDCEARILEISQ